MTDFMKNSVAQLEQIINYTFTDPTGAWEALQAAGSGVRLSGNRRITNDGNKRLALKGDAWIRLIVVEYCYEQNIARGPCSNIIGANLSNDNLATLCRRTRIDRLINLNPSTLGVASPRTMADTMEAVFAAVAEDGGKETLRRVMSELGMLRMF